MSEAKLRELLEQAEALKARAEATLDRTAKRLGQSWRRMKHDQDSNQS